MSHNERALLGELLLADRIRSYREPRSNRKWIFSILGSVGGGGMCSEPILTKSGFIKFTARCLCSEIMTRQDNPLLEVDFAARVIRLHEYDKDHPWYSAATLGNSAVYYRSTLIADEGNFPAA